MILLQNFAVAEEDADTNSSVCGQRSRFAGESSKAAFHVAYFKSAETQHGACDSPAIIGLSIGSLCERRSSNRNR